MLVVQVDLAKRPLQVRFLTRNDVPVEDNLAQRDEQRDPKVVHQEGDAQLQQQGRDIDGVPGKAVEPGPDQVARWFVVEDIGLGPEELYPSGHEDNDSRAD